MDKINDFIKELKERVSSPLIFSFIVSWLVINWRIPIGLIFYKMDELKLDGYKSYDDLILKNLNFNRNFWWPLYVALFYTFVYPIIRNLVIAFGEWIKLWGEKLNFFISKEGSIKVQRYLELREKATDLNSKLVVVLNAESETREALREKEQELDRAFETTQKLRFSISETKFFNSVQPITGSWILAGSSNLSKDSIMYDISDGLVISDTAITTPLDGRSVHHYQIASIKGDKSKSTLLLRKPATNASWDNLLIFCELQITYDHNDNLIRVMENAINGYQLRRKGNDQSLLNKFIYMPISDPL